MSNDIDLLPANAKLEDSLPKKITQVSQEARPRADALFMTTLAAKTVVDLMFDRFIPFSFAERTEKKKSLEKEKSELVAELLASGIDPVVFDSLLANEIDRRLKTKFGIAFVFLTFLFTATSYSIIVLNGIYKLGISELAITGLIIETPIQFVGLLYIIARNLFPDGQRRNSFLKSESKTKKPNKTAKKPSVG